MTHWFEYSYCLDIYRSLNHSDYKALRRWLRITRNQVESTIDLDELELMFMDAMLYGRGVCHV